MILSARVLSGTAPQELENPPRCACIIKMGPGCCHIKVGLAATLLRLIYWKGARTCIKFGNCPVAIALSFAKTWGGSEVRGKSFSKACGGSEKGWRVFSAFYLQFIVKMCKGA